MTTGRHLTSADARSKRTHTKRQQPKRARSSEAACKTYNMKAQHFATKQRGSTANPRPQLLDSERQHGKPKASSNKHAQRRASMANPKLTATARQHGKPKANRNSAAARNTQRSNMASPKPPATARQHCKTKTNRNTKAARQNQSQPQQRGST